MVYKYLAVVNKPEVEKFRQDIRSDVVRLACQDQHVIDKKAWHVT